MGATAIGTGLTASPGYAEKCVAQLAKITGKPIVGPKDLIAATSSMQGFVMFSSAYKNLAFTLSKISSDLIFLVHDGAAVQMSWDPDPPFFGMGDPASAVTIWSWKASWQRDEKGYQDIESVHPAMHLDTYPSQTDLKPGERPDPAAVSAPHHDPTYLSGWGAGNPMSNPERASAVEVAGAKGQGSLTTALREAQTVQGTGAWDRGIWTLEMRTKLPPERCRGLTVAFAAWDGASNDRNGQKSVSIWHRLDLED